jgi:hypothetical protein
MINRPLFYVVYACIRASEQYEIIGIFSKKEDAMDCTRSYPEPDYACNIIEQLSMNDIKTILVKERLLALSELLEPFIDRLGDELE